MTQFALAVSLPSSGHDPDKCCFCPLEKVQNPKIVAKIGRDNKSGTLGSNLKSAGDPEYNHLFEDSEHGRYSVEAHHLICGNEILGDEKEVEKYLITQNKQTTNKADGYIENTLHDVDWDVNSARNGIWLPSVPDLYRLKGGEPAVWWGDQNKKKYPNRVNLTDSQRNNISFIVMKAVGRQFHKGPHGTAAPPHQSYVDLGLKELKKIKVFLQYYSNVCPMEDGEEKKRKEPPYRPPHGIANTLDLLSDRLKRELLGPPSTWKYFISKYALRCQEWLKTNP